MMPRMTLQFTWAFQITMFLISFMLDETATLFDLSPNLMKWISKLISGLQMIQAGKAGAVDRFGYTLPQDYSPMRPIEDPRKPDPKGE